MHLISHACERALSGPECCRSFLALPATLRGRICPAPLARRTAGPTILARARQSKDWDLGCKLIGCGSSVPDSVISNQDLEKLVETNDEWIQTRTGIRNRHVLSGGETLSTHAAQASARALDMAGLQPEDLDLILLATSSPDDLFGSACQVQAILGASRAVAFDLTAACSGFVIGVVTAAQFIRTGAYSNVLVIGADALSRYIDWRDRGTCILFGDGCGAVIMTAQPGCCHLLGSSLHSDGNGQRHLKASYTGEGLKVHNEQHASAKGSFANILMNGSEVFKFAVRAVPMVIEHALHEAQLSKEDIDWLVLHQANQRILDSAALRLGVPSDRVISNLAEYGNTSAASIPLALDEAVRAGRIEPGSTASFPLPKLFSQENPFVVPTTSVGCSCNGAEFMAARVIIRVRYFASAREATLVTSDSFCLCEGATSATAVAMIVERHPQLEQLLKTCVLARNEVYVDKYDATPLNSGDELAIIPPVSGG